MTFNVTTTKAVSKEEKDLVLQYIKLCFRELKRKEHEINIRGPISKMYSFPRIRITCSGQVSRAGAHIIKIDTGDWRNGSKFMLEYSAFSKHALIGSQTFHNRDDALLCLVAHEVSHHVQYAYGPITDWLRHTYQKPHGTGFRNIYGILRKNVVNPRLFVSEAA